MTSIRHGAVARAYNEESVEKLRRGGAEHVVSPNQTGGIRMAFSLLRPHVVSFLDCVISDAGIELRLEQATIPHGSHLVGMSLADARIPQKTVMIVLGRSEQVTALREYADLEVK